ncbi:MAG: Ribokinase [uncultured Thermomicrobiales bacterium]|uniref:Ribokinase n=1 Tax=uncultured Thermomicrobiales bacterium TaxID=1645740 RepID=A0A6J4UY15_9BACT|nr:MAG: Ribokinase [uncultured Thermomicrobiales bacterium]
MTDGIDGGRRPRIAAIGLASWDRLLVVPSYPAAGEYRVVTGEWSLPGGTTTNTAVALARIGAAVTLAGRVGDDDDGRRLIAAMAAEPGIDTTAFTVKPGTLTDRCTIVVSGDPPDRTIFWHPGAALVRHDRLDITGLFAHDVVLLDVADHTLRRWLTDLPAHSSPRTRLLGTLTYLVENGAPVASDALEVALRFDTVVGNAGEVMALTGAGDLDAATAVIRARMVGSNLRSCAISLGADGCRICTRDEIWDVPAYPVEVVDPTGAGDAFTAGIAWGVALRWPWPRTGLLANALGAAATTAMGGQAGLPDRGGLAALTGMPEDVLVGA